MPRNQTCLGFIAFLAALATSCRSGPPAPPEIPGRSVLYTFDRFESGPLPNSFASGANKPGQVNVADADARPMSFGVNDTYKPGRWVVASTSEARSGRQVLQQIDNGGEPARVRGRAVVAWIKNTRFATSLSLSVEARTVGKETKPDFGIAFCVHSAYDYIALRADGSTRELRLERVMDTKIEVLARTKFDFVPGRWFTLNIQQDGRNVRCGVNDQPLLGFELDGEMRGGSVGLVTFDSATAEFDNLQVIGKDQSFGKDSGR